jgi:HAD superfamily hydrolase (TIGR01490 family)
MAIAFFDIDRTIVKKRIHWIILGYSWQRGWFKMSDCPQMIFPVAWSWLKALLRYDNLSEANYHPYFFLAGKSGSVFDHEMKVLFERKIKNKILESARKEILRHQKSGHSVILISAALGTIADLIGKELRVDRVIASRLERKDGILTGRFCKMIFGSEKLNQALEISSDLKKDYFYSDCSTDQALFQKVGFPRVVNPNWWFNLKARKNNWPVYYW